MPQYDVTSPDGKKFRITAPDDATQEQVLEYAKSQFQAQGQQEAPAAPPDPNAERRRIYEDTVKKRGWGSGASATIHELGGKVTDATGSPALGAATTALGEAIPIALTSGTISAPGAVPVMEKAAKGLMQSALKPPSKAIVSGDAAKAVDTLLQEGVNISAKGAAQLRSKINQLSGEVAQMISASPATVDKAHVASEVYKALQKFRNQVNPGADTKAILNSWDEFRSMVGSKIPVQEAQALKQGTYKVLADKYAKIGGAVDNEAATQAQMAMAKGLRKGIEEAVPGVGQLNAHESRLINALELAERRAGIGGNKDIGGIAWLAHHPEAAAAMMADRSAAFKSWLANRIYQARNAVPAATRSGAFAGASAVDQQEQ
jgi:hypothetical protein